MKSNYSVCVIGLWHLGCVTTACLASLGIKITAFDDDLDIIKNLKKSIPPIEEPRLAKFIENGLLRKKIHFTNNLEDLANNDFYWITYDTPVNNDDEGDIDFVLKRIFNINNQLKENSTLLISSQLPIGSSEIIKKEFKKRFKKNIFVYYIPENLRLGKSLDVFLRPDRIVVGHDLDSNITEVKNLINLITKEQIWMSNKSAEMSKHSINSFLANSVVFANEIASICDSVGANPDDVTAALKSDIRIGKYAYLKAGGPFAGGTLARDIIFLNNTSQKNNIKTPLLSSIIESNKYHKEWVIRNIKNDFGKAENLEVLILGLSYKKGTDTLRRSHSLEIANWLKNKNIIYLYDPQTKMIENNFPKNFILIKELSSVTKKIDIIITTKFWNDQLDDINHLIKNNENRIVIYDIDRKYVSEKNKFKNLNCEYKAIGI